MANAMLGLSLILYPNTRQYGSVVMNGYKGFKALIHNAEAFPEVGGKGFAIGSSKEVFVGIGAQLITATEEVEAMAFGRRNCIMKDEVIDGIELDVFVVGTCVLPVHSSMCTGVQDFYNPTQQVAQ